MIASTSDDQSISDSNEDLSSEGSFKSELRLMNHTHFIVEFFSPYFTIFFKFKGKMKIPFCFNSSFPVNTESYWLCILGLKGI